MRATLAVRRPGSSIRWLARAVLVPALMVACQELDVIAVDVMHVDVSPDAADVAIGQTQLFTATLTDGAGHQLRDRTVTWSVTDALIATVDQAGQVRGLAPGRTTITATSEGRSGQAEVNVTGVPIASVVVTPPTATLRPGESRTLEATARDGGGGVLTGRAVTWSSNNGAVAAVDNAGRVTAGAVGQAIITATAEGVSGSATITVSLDPVASVEVVPASASVEEGATFQLQAVLRAANATVLTGRPVTWSTSDGATATVNADGLVGGIRVGSATITATAEGRSGQSTITVTPLVVARVEVTPPTSSVVVGKTVQLQATAKTANGAVILGRTATWTTNAPAIAHVTPQGLVTGQAPGDATISASIDGVIGTARVSVSLAPVATVEIVPSSGNLVVGDTLTLTAITRSLDGTVLSGRSIVWTSSNTTVATVVDGGSATAKLEAKGPGEATITATAEGQSGTARFTVAPKPVASVVVAPGSANIIIDDTLRLRAVLTASDGTILTGRPVAWTSSDAGIATVDANGLVKGIGAGIATITATSEGRSGQASITVGLKPVASVVLAPPAANLIVDQTVQFAVTLRASDGTVLTGRVVVWSSLNGAVAGVDGNGLATARAPGSAGIVAQSEGKADTAVVTVAPKPVATVTVRPALDTLFVGETVQLSAELRASDNTVLTGRVVAWASSNTGVAQVNGDGLVNAVTPGQATITATSEGRSGSATIVVLALPVASVEVQPPTATVLHPGTQEFQVVLRTASGTVLTNRLVTWRSLDAGIASVTPGGGVALTATASSVGIACVGESCTARIEASAEGVADTAAFVVLKPIATVAVTPATATLPVGSSTTLQAEVKAEDGTVLTSRSLNWSSSSSNVTVQATGAAQQSATVQAVDAACAGTACEVTVTAGAEGRSGSATITVPKPVATVELAPTSLTLDEGEAGTFTATAKAADGTELTDRPATWATSSAAIAEVHGTGPFERVGEVQAKSCPVGSGSCTATITATIEGRSQQATVTVRKRVANVAVEPSALTLAQGATRTLKAVLTASDGTRLSRNVNWRSSAPGVADVQGNGAPDTLATVTAGALGSATITATAEGVSGTADVTVVEAVASVVIEPSAVTLAEGAKEGIAAIVKAASGNVLADRPVTWTTTNAGIATVTGTGSFQQTADLTAVKCPTGSPSCSATIRATADGVTGSAVVTVVKQVATVTVTPDPPPGLLPGATVQLTATPRSSDGTNLSGTRPVTWQTADPGIATVTDGLVRAVAAPCAAGSPSCTVTVSATIDGITDAVTVRVLKPVAAVQVSPATPPGLYPGETTQLTAQLSAADGTDLSGTRQVAWASNAVGVARVDASGLVTAVGTPCQQGQPACQAQITAVVEGVSDGVTVSVLKPVARVEITPSTAILTVNGSQTFGATLYAADDTPLSNRPIAWTLEIPAGSLGQGTINPTSGNSTTFTGTQVGSVVLVATSEGRTGSAPITITP